MKKPVVLTLTLAALLVAFSGKALAADAPHSMRGTDAVATDKAPETLSYQGKRPGTQKPVARTFEGQPPVIPHAVENFDEIGLETNQCMDCHSAATYKKKNAPKIGDSHFVDRDGKKLSEASARRHNCVQCHVPQVDAPPLVDNVFKGTLGKTAAKK